MVVKNAKLLLKGKVVGVNFRTFAKQNANKLGIYGYVKNLKSGDLEILAQGEELKLNQFIALCKKGPLFARVDSFSIDFLDPDPDLDYFDMRF